jgi:hypothetical protein
MDETSPKPTFRQIEACVYRRQEGWLISHWADGTRRTSAFTNLPLSMSEGEVKRYAETMMRMMS